MKFDHVLSETSMYLVKKKPFKYLGECELPNFVRYRLFVTCSVLFYILFAIAYPFVHFHAHQAETGLQFEFVFHPPEPCPLTHHDGSEHQACHHQVHPQTIDTEFCQRNSTNLSNILLKDIDRFCSESIHPQGTDTSKLDQWDDHYIESQSIPPPQEWSNIHVSRGPPFLS